MFVWNNTNLVLLLF